MRQMKTDVSFVCPPCLFQGDLVSFFLSYFFLFFSLSEGYVSTFSMGEGGGGEFCGFQQTDSSFSG